MEGVVSSLISTYLAEYVRDIDGRDVTDFPWSSGMLKLINLSMNTEVCFFAH